MLITKKDNPLLRSAQLKMLTALIEIDRLCSLHDIEYWIDAGTLLGAVRHSGFIPWDDDIDICMTRDNFNKFINIASKNLNKDLFFLQTSQTDKNYYTYNIPCKMRINNTEIIEETELKYGYYNSKSHHGLFVDIFPYDKYSTNSFIRTKIERFLSKIYQLKSISKFKKISLDKKIIVFLLSPLIPKIILNRIKEIQFCIMNNRRTNYVYSAGIETPFHRAVFTEEEIFPLKKISFEGYLFSCPNNIDQYLTKMFGANYMSLPPIENRISHYHSIKI
ncbi:TPA: LicD family protein [Proteus mirabilis]|nr:MULTISPECIES: LicD family protein [Proteus]ATC73996.1 hypothetical protein BG257_04985 [Proteus mirabilis]ATC77315.1 hypothetical protein BG029_02130 [Proteus mirabilis]ELA7643339.1 LicD family protein [Proteus mirabilis]EMF0795249.1 LicD family protein [Proteus mirabilis]MBG2753900.1 LicD family protein [Proteus mirabilis]